VFDKFGTPDHVARVTTFTTAPMQRDREFTGHAMLTLYASTDQTDLDAIVKVPLVSADADAGLPVTVSRGWLRAAHRPEEDPELTSDMRPFHSHDRAEPLQPGQVYQLRVELLPMSFLARQGDRIRLEINNNDAQNDAPMTHFYGRKVGTDTYRHDRTYLSSLRLRERPR
jgi:uncharacterized protein